MADITSIGGATLDVFLRVPHAVTERGDGRFMEFPLGAKLKVQEVTLGCGGGAANTSVGFARLGLSAGFCGVIGSDEWGEMIASSLRREGVLLHAAVVVEREVSGFSVILLDAPSGDRTIFYAPNTNAHLSDPVLAKDILRAGRWLFLNHLPDVSSEILDDCLELVSSSSSPGTGPSTPPRSARGRSGQANRLRFAWNPGGSQLRDGSEAPVLRELLRNTDALFLNREEAALFFHASSASGALRCAAEAGVRVACITDGARGAWLSDGVTVWHCDALPDTKVVEATGAGDAFAVGVTWGLISSLDLPKALLAGMLNAASVLGMVGAQAGLLEDAEMRARLAAASTPLTAVPLRNFSS